MRPLVIVELEVAVDARPRLRYHPVVPQVHLFVLQRAPQASSFFHRVPHLCPPMFPWESGIFNRCCRHGAGAPEPTQAKPAWVGTRTAQIIQLRTKIPTLAKRRLGW